MPYHRLEVYKKAYQLALEIHKESMKFPKHEQYELANQHTKALSIKCFFLYLVSSL